MFSQRIDLPDENIEAVDIVRDALQIASNEARVSQSYIAPKHLLFGLAKSIAGALPDPMIPLQFTPEARKVWNMAVELGREHVNGKITVSDLLTALAIVNWPDKFRSGQT